MKCACDIQFSFFSQQVFLSIDQEKMSSMTYSQKIEESENKT